METCPCCGDEYRVEVMEYWSATREFALDACCEGAHQDAVEDMQTWTRKQWQRFMEQSAGLYVRQVVPDQLGGLALDYGLEVVPVDQATARAFIETHHRHNRAPAGWKFGAAIVNGADLVGIVWAGRPVSRVMQAQGALEINRCCVRTDLAAGLTWNGCSQLYGWACQEAARLGYRTVITYTLESEQGTSLKAAGFTAVARTKGGTWNTPSRPRTDKAPTCRKVRWQRDLKPQRQAQRAAIAAPVLSTPQALLR